MEIYAEWTNCGAFDNGFFHTWEEFYNATFSPDVTVKVVKIVR